MPLLTFDRPLDVPSDPDSPYYTIKVNMGQVELPPDLGYLDVTSVDRGYSLPYIKLWIDSNNEDYVGIQEMTVLYEMQDYWLG